MTQHPDPDATTGEADAWRAGKDAERAALLQAAQTGAPLPALVWVMGYLGKPVPVVAGANGWQHSAPGDATGLEGRGA